MPAIFTLTDESEAVVERIWQRNYSLTKFQTREVSHDKDTNEADCFWSDADYRYRVLAHSIEDKNFGPDTNCTFANLRRDGGDGLGRPSAGLRFRRRHPLRAEVGGR